MTTENRGDIACNKVLARQDEVDRIDIEGRFGTAKRRYGLDKIMGKLTHTSEGIIAIIFLVMNLEKVLRDLLCLFLFQLRKAVDVGRGILMRVVCYSTHMFRESAAGMRCCLKTSVALK